MFVDPVSHQGNGRDVRIDLFLHQGPGRGAGFVDPVSCQRSWHDMRIDLFLCQGPGHGTRVAESFVRLNDLGEK